MVAHEHLQESQEVEVRNRPFDFIKQLRPSKKAAQKQYNNFMQELGIRNMLG